MSRSYEARAAIAGAKIGVTVALIGLFLEAVVGAILSDASELSANAILTICFASFFLTVLPVTAALCTRGGKKLGREHAEADRLLRQDD